MENDNVTYVDISKYKKLSKLNTMREKFINYGAKDDKTELFCGIRVIMIGEFMKEYKLEKILISIATIFF